MAKSNLKADKIPAKTKVKSEKIIVTAALPYANGPVHMGHLLESIQGDIFNRFLRLQGKDSLYICASDMHGTPIEINAQKAGIPAEKFAEKYWKEHQEDFKGLLVKFDEFYKTHSPENKELAEFFFQELKKKKLIYIKEIETIYCNDCRRYLPDRYVKGTCPHCQAKDQYGDICEKCGNTLKGIDLLDPYCSICKKTPVRKGSKHYFFKLSNFQKELKAWYNSEDSWIQPEVKNWLNEWLGKGLEDWCVSRDAPYFGFEILGAEKEIGEKKYFYVWLDAPIGYISSTKHYCSTSSALRSRKYCDWEDYWKKGKIFHFIGKDIAYFHFLFWPAMLMAVGIPLPKLTVHGFITVNGEKMSKSKGTFFTVKDCLKLFPPESLRFYYAQHLDRKLVDIDLNWKDFQSVNNNVLVSNLGNFCYRALIFAQKNYGKISSVAEEKELLKEINDSLDKIEKYYSEQDYKLVVKEILHLSDLGNVYFQKAEPWKDKDDKEVRSKVGFCVNLARNLAIVSSPILPEFSRKILSALGNKDKSVSWKDLSFSWKGLITEVPLLVSKIEDETISKVEVVPETSRSEDKLFPLHLCIGEITEVRDHPNAESLYLFQVDFGRMGKRQVVAGLKKYFSKSKLAGKKTVFVVNLKKAKIRGELSEAMTLVAEDKSEKIFLLSAGKSKPGEEAKFSGLENNHSEIGFEEFSKLKIVAQKERVVYDGRKLLAGKEEVLAKGAEDGSKLR